jgi:hypothetical protein
MDRVDRNFRDGRDVIEIILGDIMEYIIFDRDISIFPGYKDRIIIKDDSFEFMLS